MPGMLGDKSFHELAMMRDRAPLAEQGMLAPFEHRAFAREWSRDNPWVAGVSLPVAVPAYQLAKMLGLMGARTEPSLDQMFAGYHGYAEGMLPHFTGTAQAAEAPPPQRAPRPISGAMPAPRTKPRTRHYGGGVRG